MCLQELTGAKISGRQAYGTAALIILVLAVLNVFLIVQIDNTNLGTTNGLWKAPAVRAWEQGTGQPGDTGGLLYIPTYGLLARCIPDELVSYGEHGAVVTFRKMAMLNALFGALSSAVVFLLVVRFASSFAVALVAAIAHASSGFVLLNSLNSEDVIPAYAFFTAAALAFLEYTRTKRRIFIFIACAMLAAVTLFHWTLMIPATGAVAVVLPVLVLRKRCPASSLVLFPACFLGILGLFVVFCRFHDSSTSISLLSVLYPAKAGPSGWLGFGWNKAIYVLLGTGNYFSGAQNMGNYGTAFQSGSTLGTLGVSWLYLAITLGAAVWGLRARTLPHVLRIFSGFAVAVFLIGQLEHLYSQPQDPQSQIQPMFVTVAGLTVLLFHLRITMRSKAYRLLLGGLAVVFAANGAINVSLMYRDRGLDGRAVGEVLKLVRMFPPERTKILSTGTEGWNTWMYVEVFRGDSEQYLDANIHLFRPITLEAGLSMEEAAERLSTRIREALSNGYQVVAADLWTRPREDFVHSMTTLVNEEKASRFYDALHGSFRTGRSWNTPVGPFVELLAPGPGKASEP